MPLMYRMKLAQCTLFTPNHESGTRDQPAGEARHCWRNCKVLRAFQWPFSRLNAAAIRLFCKQRALCFARTRSCPHESRRGAGSCRDEGHRGKILPQCVALPAVNA